MDLDPALWGIVMLVITAAAGGLMVWSSKLRKRS